MAYDARVLKIMIASPSDVPVARRVFREVVHEWNSVHSEDRNLVLMPVGWESHAVPEFGGRPQALINRQVLKGCDLLVAVLWTRLGSPTGTAPSGTVEEINEHVNAGKPAMIYFSDEPVRMDSVDESQWNALRQFRGECEQRGLIEVYESASDLRNKFARQLATAIVRNVAQIEIQSVAQSKEAEEDQKGAWRPGSMKRESYRVSRRLSDAARELLFEASRDQGGFVTQVHTFGGVSIATHGREFVESQEKRTIAKWVEALEYLATAGLIVDRIGKSEVFWVTDRGFEAADAIATGG